MLSGGAHSRIARRARRWWPAEWRVLKYGAGLPIEAIRRAGWALSVVCAAGGMVVKFE